MAESGHLGPEAMIALDQPYTQFEELEALSDMDLAEISQLCPEGTYDSVNCVPCRAGEILEERKGALYPSETDEVAEFEPEEDRPTPKLDALMAEPSPFQEDVPVVEQFARQVESLSLLVTQMLQGPPIPPKDVTLEELAFLVYGAEKWMAIIASQGLELGEKQQTILSEIQRVITKVRA